MGRGDQRSRKGKIFARSYGKRRKHKPTAAKPAAKA
jgi:ribosomal small subunit protein bTHX